MNKEIIRDTALDLFRKISFAKTSVSDIAQACGLGKGTIYLYFENKDDIFASIIEERMKALEVSLGDYYRDPGVPLRDKIKRYFESLVDEYFIIKDLLFGSFENVQGRMLKDVFFKFGRYYQLSIDNLILIIKSNIHEGDEENIRTGVTQLMELMVGRMLVFLLVNEWNDKEGLKATISPLSEKLFNVLVQN
jgi:AcrR family transcriptional regulator